MSLAPGDRDWKPRADVEAEEFQSHVELLAALARSLHSAGLPAHRLESMMTQTAARLETPVEVFSLPTGVMVAVGPETSPVTMLLRVEPSGVHLERLSRLMAIARGIARGQLEAPEAKRRIDFVMRAKPYWGPVPTVAAYVLSAGAFSVFFGGAIPEIVTAICVGLAVGLIAISMQQLRTRTRLFELFAAAAAAAIANVAYNVHSELVVWIPLASGLIILLPGLSLVDALDELAHGHLTSGGSRLSGVGVVLLVMGFGAVLGTVLVAPGSETYPDGVPQGSQSWWIGPALIAVAFGSMIRFRARWRDFWAALGASTIALGASRLASLEYGSFAGPFLAAFILGSAANVFAAVFRQPAQLLTVPGLAMLVPGSFGVRSLSSLLSHDVSVGVDTAFHMFLTAMALVCGILISNSFFRETLHDEPGVRI
jgi:uncharacterized membrane protein YjjP (DUF1212 family)